jgi:RND family efflux transporter MFP subunit
MMMKFKTNLYLQLSYLTLCLLAACSGKPEGAPQAAASSASGVSNAPSASASAPAPAASAPAVSVTTVRAKQRDLPVMLKATGTVTPASSVDVKPQITSVISAVHFKEGQFVRKGELLFTLDSRPDEANVAKARAQLAKDQAALADAKRQLERSKQLLAQNFISQGALDTNQSAVEAQTAVVNADQAAIDAVRVSLSYARITAPSAGRVGAVNVFAGSAVQANQTTLVTITQLDPITVSFNLPQSNLASSLAALSSGGAAVTASLPNGGAVLNGRLQFVDNLIDPATGTVKVKARFDNKEGKLWPGAFVEVTLNVDTLKNAIVVPQAAIIQSARGPIAYSVENGKAVARKLQVLSAQGDDAAVSGINAGEQIIVDGKQNIRPGASIVERSDGKGAAGAANKPKEGASAAANPLKLSSKP